MSTSPQFPGVPKTQHRQLVPGHATRFRPLWTPGTSGSQISGVGLRSSDTAANAAIIGIGKAITLASAMGTANFVDNGASADTITRSVGSFVTDGWITGERLLANGATTLANDFDVLLTGVAAGTLTLATGGGTVNTAEALAAGVKLYRLIQLGIISIPLSAGSTEAAASISGLDTTELPFLDVSPDRLLLLGSDDILFVAALNTLGSGEVLDVFAEGADY
jgi:hypothetical protein